MLVKKVGKYFLCTSLLNRVRFFVLDENAVYVYYHIWIVRDYERLVKPRGIVLDIGAHVGLFTLRCLKSSNTSLVVALEPHPENARLLYTNVLMNGLRNRVIIVSAAAGPKNGRAKLFIANASSEHSLVPLKDKQSIDVNMVSLDGLVDSLNLQSIDYIKIDVEGAELEVIRGGARS
ncbi:FkbM family methyltransferase [Candidatus Bathyarchaeota archaeon]|nr:FkbM family methyltransferase [Candidatus Bathyarchaeota archaeon]